MKKLLTIIALTVLNTGIYAQKVFDETVFNGMMSRMQTDTSFFRNEADPGFIVTWGSGSTSNRETMLKYAKNNIGLYKRKESNVKITQVGNTGIATGTLLESFLSKDNPNIVSRTSENLFTYTFSKVKNKWLLVAAQHTAVPTPFTKETLNEIFSEYKADSKAFMNSHLSDDWRYINFRSGYQGRKDFIGGTKQSIVTTEMLDPVIFQSGNLAVTSGIHQTVRTTSDGRQETGQVGATYTWQNIGGKWMFVASQQNAVAPPTFDEAIFNGMITRWGNDPAGFVKNECDAKFIFTDGNGHSYTYQQAVDTYADGFSKIDKKVENVKVWQSGSTGFATGKTIEGFKFKDGTSYIYTGIFTYTFSQQNGKWVLASAQHTDYQAPKAEDEAAIKAAIEGEAAGFKERNAEKTINYWLKTPYTSHTYTAKGTGYLRGNDKISNAITGFIKANPKADKSPLNFRDYVIQINGNSAWATFISDGTSNGKKVSYNKASYLEKTNGNWKIGSVVDVESK